MLRILARPLSRTAAVIAVLARAPVRCWRPASSRVKPEHRPTRAKLSRLTVKPEGSTTAYNRDLYRHWSDAQENGWRLPPGTPDPESRDTREAALIRDGEGENVESGCEVNVGRWFI